MVNHNEKIITEFEKLIIQVEYEFSKLTEEKDKRVQRIRINQLKNILRIIKKHASPIKSSKDVAGYYGIGKNTLKRIDEIIKNGKLKEIDEKIVKENKKDSKAFIIQELSKIIGIGKSQAERLIKEHKIKSVDDLLDKYQKKKITVSHKIDKGLKYFNKVKKAIPRSEMKGIDALLEKEVPKIDKDLTVIVCGSYRRGKDKSNDIDVLVTHKKIKTQKQFDKAVEKKNYLQDIVTHLKTVKKSNTKFMVDDLDLDYTTKYNGFCRLGKKPIRRIDIRFMPHDSYYTALLYYTGSGDFNKLMRLTAKKKGYKLSEYNLCEYVEKDGKKICKEFKIKSEKDVFDKLGMKYLAPEKR